MTYIIVAAVLVWLCGVSWQMAIVAVIALVLMGVMK